jgi:GT2 family glycosyltransferase
MSKILNSNNKLKEGITFILTACGRPELLEKTLDSFFKFNTYPHIEKYIIIEDSGIKDINNHLMLKYRDKNIQWIINKKNIGHLASVDIAYSKVYTKYIFHCQDDWEFIDYSFIEKSLEIMENNSNISLVWLRGKKDTRHPVIEYNDQYDIASKNYSKTWSGFTFNPGLRKTEDYHKIKPFAPYRSESNISKKYKEMDFTAAVLKTKHVIHTGGKQSALNKYKRRH